MNRNTLASVVSVVVLAALYAIAFVILLRLGLRAWTLPATVPFLVAGVGLRSMLRAHLPQSADDATSVPRSDDGPLVTQDAHRV